ncbi:hypothetical protein CEE69_07595 [Rhodopirellula bahusiensis]|uniref:Uncharacterized protein n=1 Tax=Rhodopirellula bahusiensis TaxID=2014065 RepID=A0A2G1WAH3_9BACT|nr:hypothetical protein CEE69_07595 [Rhodopirellula bahusiensis]
MIRKVASMRDLHGMRFQTFVLEQPMSRSVVADSPRLYSNGQPWRNARGRNAPRQAHQSADGR